MNKKNKIFSGTTLLIMGAVLLIISGAFLFGSFIEEEVGCGIVSDVEGNRYKTVEIGEQCWFAENLKTTKYRNEERINEAPTHAHADDAWNTEEPVYTWYNHGNFHDKEKDYVREYGYLYNFHVVNYYKKREDSGYRVCPEGWRVPTHKDWAELEILICKKQGGEECEEHFHHEEKRAGYRGTDEGNMLKSEEFDGPEPATDKYGFSGAPGGLRYENGAFSPLDYYASWWTSTESNGRAWARELYDTESGIGRLLVETGRGHHIRCIQE